MRLPSIRELTARQKQVYLYAPTDNHVLVSGPPGTGKTLIACLRAKEMKLRQSPALLCMFNRVLKKYSSNAGTDGQMPSETLTRWFREWWVKSGLPPHPQCSELHVDVPYAEKDRVKSLGGIWNHHTFPLWKRSHKPGVWTIRYETWDRNRAAFTWPVYSAPPGPSDKPFQIDWRAVKEHVLNHEQSLPDLWRQKSVG